MNILLISGHSPTRLGASGNGFHEYALTIEGVQQIKAQLDKYDANIHVYDTARDAFTDAQQGKLLLPVKYDYAFELHFNAHSNASAHGTECFVTSKEVGIAVEQGIMKHMGKYFTLRDNDSLHDGVKRTDYLVIKTLKDKGISSCLLETCFISNKSNMDVFVKNEVEIYKGIADAIATGFKLSKKAEAPKPTTDAYVGKEVTLKGYLYTTATGNGKKNTSIKSGVISKKHTSGSHPYLLGQSLGWLSETDFTLVTATSSTKIEVGKPAKIKAGAIYMVNGGNPGAKVGASYIEKYYNVAEIRMLKGVECARLAEINSWIKVKDLSR